MDKPEALRLADALSGVLYSAKDTVDAAAELRKLQRKVEVLLAERDQARAQFDHAVKLLIGIHSLLYPAPITTPDGRTMVFRPKSPDPHEVLQALSDRIRALPDEIARAAIAKAEGA